MTFQISKTCAYCSSIYYKGSAASHFFSCQNGCSWFSLFNNQLNFIKYDCDDMAIIFEETLLSFMQVNTSWIDLNISIPVPQNKEELLKIIKFLQNNQAFL